MEWINDATPGHWLRPLLDPSWSDMHIVAGVELHGGGLILDAAGWRYLEPRQGNLDPRVLAGVATHLADHTTTPDVGIAAVCEGWGGQPTVVAAAPRLYFPIARTTCSRRRHASSPTRRGLLGLPGSTIGGRTPRAFSGRMTIPGFW